MAVEPAWHRRARRLRSGHRLLAQVSAACVKLAGHHGSCPPEILKPLLSALSTYAPRPCDVPWPDALITIGSHRSPKTMIMPNIDITEVAVDPAVASSSSTLSSLVQGSLAGESQYLDIPEVAVVSPAATTSPSLVPFLSDGEWRPLSFNTSPTSFIDIPGVVVASVVASSSSTLTGDFRSLPGDYWRSLSFPSSLVSQPNECGREFRDFMLETRAKYLQQRSVVLRLGPPDHPHIVRVTTCLGIGIELIRYTLSQLPAMLTVEHVHLLKRTGENFYVCVVPITLELSAAINELASLAA
jgi:hypothetical protein